MTRNQDAVAELAASIRAAGFRVFVAERGDYGFYTDADGTRVVSFGPKFGGFKFSGNYKTSNPKSTGTGWQLNTGSFADMFAATAPKWATQGAKWEYTTLAQHLAVYQSSSKYSEQAEPVAA